MIEVLFTSGFGQRALVAATVVGAVAPVVGAFLVQRRLSLVGDGIGHLALAGVALGVLVGVSGIWGALIVALLGAAGLEALRVRGRLTGDLSLALIFYLGIATGAVGLSLAGRFNTSILSVLFGSLFALSWADVGLIALLGALVVLVVLFIYRPLLAVALDEETARAAGLPVDLLNLVLVALTALLVVGGMRVVGLLLVAALMVVPVAAGSKVAHSFRATMGWAVFVGAAAAWAGLLVAAWHGELVPGGTIVLAAIALFIGFAAVGRRTAVRHVPRREA
ncbi:MAG TPA: metal ABC transporter permease [Propionibacteriaceae bacterium]|nr:metal ABC transporter permease [Propionibacteriaceae bacterium]